jgi:hypothetical protein
MRSRTSRRMPLFVTSMLVVALTGLVGPGAISSVAQTGFTVSLLNQPADALVNQTITSVPLNPTQGFLRVLVTDGESGVPGIEVTFELATGPGLAAGSLSVIPQVTDESGVATFGPGTVSIADANEPQFTDYKLIPVASEPVGSESLAPASIAESGAPSNGFDIVEAGCKGSGCSVAIRNGLDVYTTTQNVRLTASVLSASTLPDLQCRNQMLVFPSDVFVHETNGTGVVGLRSHVTASDLAGGGGGGTAAVASADDDDDGPRIKWCVGTLTKAPWVKNGAPFTRRDTNGDGTLDLFVGSAPTCPKTKPRTFAPCIVSRVRDGAGGFIIRGWLPGGDPPRRT